VPRIAPFLPRLVICGFALGGLALAGCTTDSDLQQLNQNQFTLRGMIANDRQEIDSLQTQVRALKEQVTEISHGGGGGASGDQLSSINDRLNKLDAQVSGVQAGMSAAPVGAAPAAPGVAVASVPSAPSAMAPPPTAAVAEGQPTWPQELDQEIDAAQSSREPGVKVYRDGLAAMKDGQYPLAISKFTELSHHYPKSPLVTPAQYFTANALYESGKYDQAILQFNDAVMRDPKGKYASQALLREAQAFMKVNDSIDARLTLQKLLADHADSPEAPTATALMKSLSG
jgi:tol-pal system protein YbgF